MIHLASEFVTLAEATKGSSALSSRKNTPDWCLVEASMRLSSASVCAFHECRKCEEVVLLGGARDERS